MRLTREQSIQKDNERYESNLVEYGDWGFYPVLLLRWHIRNLAFTKMMYDNGGARIIPSLIKFDEGGVQPMTEPTGLIHALRVKYIGDNNERK